MWSQDQLDPPVRKGGFEMMITPTSEHRMPPTLSQLIDSPKQRKASMVTNAGCVKNSVICTLTDGMKLCTAEVKLQNACVKMLHD